MEQFLVFERNQMWVSWYSRANHCDLMRSINAYLSIAQNRLTKVSLRNSIRTTETIEQKFSSSEQVLVLMELPGGEFRCATVPELSRCAVIIVVELTASAVVARVGARPEAESP